MSKVWVATTLSQDDIDLIEKWGREWHLNTRSKILQKAELELFGGRHLRKEDAMSTMARCFMLGLLSMSIVLSSVFL